MIYDAVNKSISILTVATLIGPLIVVIILILRKWMLGY